jgi:hypothetical protein
MRGLHTYRTHRANFTTAPTLVNANTMLVAIGDWANYASLNRIAVSPSKNVTNLQVTVVTDLAKYAADSDKWKYIQAQSAIANVVGNAYHTFDFDGVYVEDPTRCNLLYVVLTTSSTFTTETEFRITAEGLRTLPRNSDADRPAFANDKSFRVLRKTTAGGLNEITTIVTSHGDPYSHQPVTILENASDFLYIGGHKMPTDLNFYLLNNKGFNASITPNFEYWNGSTWATIPNVEDGTSNGQAGASMNHSGVVKFNAPNNWARHALEDDPVKAMQDSVAALEAWGQQISYDASNYYWIRFSASSVPAALKAWWVLPLLGSTYRIPNK